MAAAFGYALEGLAAAWRGQRNVRIHAGIVAVVVVGGVVIRLPLLGWAVVALAVGLVLGAELLNTALEAVVDLVSPQDHPLAKLAKDCAAAAVLVAALAAAAAGLLIGAWSILRP
ncbi:MAG TPA: diacylglycerol kinase family protein [Candidatus Sulfotelmatobacter sp.]|nr:diacylglycerol kinase family protein [Candidatus Sulfotelmatobacter sp.]